MTRYRTIIRDMIAVEIPKGKRDIYKIAAQELGLSLSRLVQNGVEEYIKNHANEVPVEIEESAKVEIKESAKVEIKESAKVEEKIKEAMSRLGEKSAKVGKNLQKQSCKSMKTF